MDVFLIRAKPCCVVNLVLKENPRDMISHKVGMVMGIAVLHEEEFLDRLSTEREHGRAKLAQAIIANLLSPQTPPVQKVKLCRR
jgi:hypothetical protein